MKKQWGRKMLCAALVCVQILTGLAAVQAAETAAEQETVKAADPGTVVSEQLLEGITAENYPMVDGSTATLPLSAAVYQLVTGSSQKETDQAIVHTKTTNSWMRLIADEVDLLIVADKNEKVDAEIAATGTALDIKPIALDAFIFMANEENPVKSLTQDQIVGIYSGQITNWSQVGGADQEIVPFQRNENAGSQTAMKSLVMKGQEMIPPEKFEIGTMDGLLEAVASYNNDATALGYSYYYYANLMYRTPGLRFMAVDGVIPSNESVQKGEYPYIAQYYAAIRTDEPADTPARKIFEWLTTTQGQELAADLGYIPLDQSIQPVTIHTDEVSETPIPFDEDERLAIRTGRGSLVILDREGRVTERFDNAILGEDAENPALGRAFDAVILDADEPVPLGIKTGDGEWDYKIGLYSLEESRWLIEPEHGFMKMLSDTLCTNASIMMGGGELMKTDGTVLVSTEFNAFRRMGDYIVSDTHVFDEDGTLLSTITGGYPVGLINDNLVLYTDAGTTVLQDAYGNQIWTEASGLSYFEDEGDYINWMDLNGGGLITNHTLSMIMHDGLFWQINPQYAGSGSGLQVVAAEDGKEQIVVCVTDQNSWKNRYFVCDRAFKVIEALPFNQVCEDYNSEDIWIYEMEGSVLKIREFWSGYTAEIPFSGDASNGFTISREENLVNISWFDSEWTQHSKIIAGGTVRDIPFAGGQIAEVDDGIISVYSYDWQSAKAERVFFDQNGNIVCGGDGIKALYADENFRCVQYGSYIYVENYDGVMYVRLLASDEEIEEPKQYNFWEEY